MAARRSMSANGFSWAAQSLCRDGFRVSPFMVANAGAPFNITTGTDLNGDSIFNDRPAFAGGASGPTIVDTNFGSFNTSPAPGQTTIPSNFGTSPAQFTMNLRLSKTIGMGPRLEASNPNPQQGKGGQYTPAAHGGEPRSRWSRRHGRPAWWRAYVAELKDRTSAIALPSALTRAMSLTT